MKILKKNDFGFLEVGKDFRENFKCADCTLSDFHHYALVWIAEAIKPKNACGVWCDNNYWWDAYDGRWSVFTTDNGIPMLKNWDTEQLYRIIFK